MTIQILLVESNPEHRDFVQKILETEENRFSLTQASNLGQALAEIERNPPDVILLDLNLEDSQGLDTFMEIRKATELPVVILPCSKEAPQNTYFFLPHCPQDVAHQCLQHTILFALENHRISKMVERTKKVQQVKKELGTLERLCCECHLGTPLLELSHPGEFQSFVQLYREILEKGVKIFSHKMDSSLEEFFRHSLEELATGLGSLGASAKDILNLHKKALQTKLSHFSKEKQALETSRIVVFELLLYLLEFYRKHYLTQNQHSQRLSLKLQGKRARSRAKRKRSRPRRIADTWKRKA